MPRKVELKVYNFDELSPKAKARAIEDYRPHAFDQGDSDFLTELFQERLGEVGLPTKKLGWNLSCSQGDGVGFYGPIDLGKFIKVLLGGHSGKGPLEWSPRSSKYESLIKKIGVILEPRSNQYHHSNNMNIVHDVYEDLSPEEDGLLKDLLEEVDKKVREVSKELEKSGYEEIEYRQSDDAITDFFQGNEWEFLEDGKRWRQPK